MSLMISIWPAWKNLKHEHKRAGALSEAALYHTAIK